MFTEQVIAFVQVVFIDLVLAADNAVVVGMAAAGLPAHFRSRAIAIGIALAVILRIVFSLLTVQLLEIPGILIVGGALLLWVAWRLYREIIESGLVPVPEGPGQESRASSTKSLRAGITQIIIADVSMSIDNVLAVAGAARHHTTVLVFGLTLSVILMAVAATMIARWMERFPWIAWLGLVVIVYVGADMIYDGLQPFI